MKIAPSSSIMMGSLLFPLDVDSPATFLATCPFVKSSSSASRFRFPVEDAPFVVSASSEAGCIAGFGLRGMSTTCFSTAGLTSSVAGSVLYHIYLALNLQVFLLSV